MIQLKNGFMRKGFKIFPIATESPREMEFFGSGNIYIIVLIHGFKALAN